MVTIYATPEDKNCKVCIVMKKIIESGKNYGVAFYDEVRDCPIQVESIPRFCANCGKELISEEATP